MKFPIIELIDRLSIARVKSDRGVDNDNELKFYTTQLKDHDMHLVSTELAELTIIHNTIWDAEWQLKAGKEDELDLAEIGRRAIKIRDWNNKRVKLKNIIAEKLGCDVKEIKKDHASD